ncbi:hypothetical protein GCM10022288_11080 [Gryllotalpicola kribbensis]|uniref:Uncharacterized protein n=1 Tax=Gryllotalpicola kribbensis TaxID=993084 RepID=A0ABP8ANF0_9MICO
MSVAPAETAGLIALGEVTMADRVVKAASLATARGGRAVTTTGAEPVPRAARPSAARTATVAPVRTASDRAPRDATASVGRIRGRTRGHAETAAATPAGAASGVRTATARSGRGAMTGEATLRATASGARGLTRTGLSVMVDTNSAGARDRVVRAALSAVMTGRVVTESSGRVVTVSSGARGVTARSARSETGVRAATVLAAAMSSGCGHVTAGRLAATVMPRAPSGATMRSIGAVKS